MGYLAFAEEELAFIVFVGEGERAAFAAHFEGLHQVDYVHLQKAAAEHSVGEGTVLARIFSSAILSITRLMRWVASLQKKNGFSTKSSTGRSGVLSFSLMSVLVATRIIGGFGGARDGFSQLFDELAAIHTRQPDGSRKSAGREDRQLPSR